MVVGDCTELDSGGSNREMWRLISSGSTGKWVLTESTRPSAHLSPSAAPPLAPSWPLRLPASPSELFDLLLQGELQLVVHFLLDRAELHRGVGGQDEAARASSRYGEVRALIRRVGVQIPPSKKKKVFFSRRSNSHSPNTASPRATESAPGHEDVLPETDCT
jgi:hypothetical protein